MRKQLSMVESARLIGLIEAEYATSDKDDIEFAAYARLKLNGPRPFLQWSFTGPCSKTGEVKEQPCRKWQLSFYMTAGEIVQTAFAAALQAEEHECREFFRWKGRRLFNPHLPLTTLWERAEEEEVRS